MPKILLILFAVIVTAHSLRAAPEAPGKAAEAAELQDRIDRRAQEIATMTAYCARLERILARAGLPPDESARPLALENGKVKVITAEQTASNVLTRTYDVTAVLPRYPTLQEAQEVLEKLVTNTVAADSWQDAGGTVGLLHFNGVHMSVTQTPENLAAVEDLLEELDDNKRIAHRRAIIDRQQIQIVALSMEIDKRVARCRSVGIQVPPRLDRAMELVLPDIQFIGSPLSACFDALGSASGQLIYVQWKILRAAGIDGRKPITLNLRRQTLAAALQSLIDKASEGNAPLQYDTQDNAINVSTQQEYDKLTITRVYDVREILPLRGTRQEAMDQIISAITTTIDPESWRDAGGTVGSIRDFQGQLIITQSDRVQARIKAYLNLLHHQRQLMRGGQG